MHRGGFESRFREKSDLNQYWYSSATVAAIRDELTRLCPQRVAFVSTPSLFFAVYKNIQESYLFDIDVEFDKVADGRFIRFDYKYPEISACHHAMFDAVIMDPPFISEEVIAAYVKVFRTLARTTRSILMFTSTRENQHVIERELHIRVSTAPFLPCIPNLVYQYRIFVNYELDSVSPLSELNKEIDSHGSRNFFDFRKLP